MHSEIPLIIRDSEASLYGVLTLPSGAGKLVVLLPAATGTRLGPQRIFVEMARKLATRGIATLRIDLPPNGDSFDAVRRELGGSPEERITARYGVYLDKIVGYMQENHRFSEYILSSISVGCMPVLHYAKRKGYARVLLLSPNHLAGKTAGVNKKNARAYAQKLFQWQYLRKLFTGRMNLKKILGNLFNTAAPRPAVRSGGGPGAPAGERSTITVSCIFGEKDAELAACRQFWGKYQREGRCGTYQERVILNADHSFFGWRFKEEVSEAALNWISVNP